MPVEIRELLIRTEVTGESGGGETSGSGKADREAIIEESVQRVLELLRKSEER